MRARGGRAGGGGGGGLGWDPRARASARVVARERPRGRALPHAPAPTVARRGGWEQRILRRWGALSPHTFFFFFLPFFLREPGLDTNRSSSDMTF